MEWNVAGHLQTFSDARMFTPWTAQLLLLVASAGQLCVNPLNKLKWSIAAKQTKNCYPVSVETVDAIWFVFMNWSKIPCNSYQLYYSFFFLAQIGKINGNKLLCMDRCWVLINTVFTGMVPLSLIEARLHRAGRKLYRNADAWEETHSPFGQNLLVLEFYWTEQNRVINWGWGS